MIFIFVEEGLWRRKCVVEGNNEVAKKIEIVDLNELKVLGMR